MRLRERGASLIKSSIMAVGLLFLSYIAFTDMAYAIHKGAGDLVCGSCHTMHNSQGGSSLNAGGAAGGSLVLLRGPVTDREDIHKFCLQCHATNGAQATTLHGPKNVMAPKVWSSATWTSDDPFNKIGSGGNFSPELDSSWNASTANYLGLGHSLGATTITPPGGDVAIGKFSCVNCHDPHGTSSAANTAINIFRNLRVNATDAGLNSGVKFVNAPAFPYAEMHSYVGGVSVGWLGVINGYFGNAVPTETDNGNNAIWPVYRGTLTGNPVIDSANSNAYASGSDAQLSANATMSKWCAQCHDDWHEAIVETNFVGFSPPSTGNSKGVGPDWRRHPVNAMMSRDSASGCATGCHTSLNDRSTYSLSLIIDGKGLPVTASKYYVNNAYYLPTCDYPGSGDCAGGMDTIGGINGYNHKVFCLSCHFAHGGPYNDNLRWNHTASISTGGQVGQGIPVNKGCQLCHNRGA